MFGLAHHTPRLSPALTGLIGEVFELARGFTRGRELFLHTLQFATQDLLQTRVFRQAKQIVHTIPFAPGHDGIAAEPTVSPHHDLDVRPLGAQTLDDPLNLFQGSGRSVDV